MINAQRTGAYISSLRKAKDWTQQELAERLHVTHQAVSQWEKGASFPDVGLLPALARLLGVSVDDLLNGAPAPRTGRLTAGGVVEELAQGGPAAVARQLRADPEGVGAMLEAAPLARPSQLDQVVASLGGVELTLDQLAELAPFISREALGDIVARAGLDAVDGRVLGELAPFLDRETLAGLAQRAIEGTLPLDQLVELAPFLPREALLRLMDKALADGEGLSQDHLIAVAPFVGQQAIDGLIERVPDGALPASLVAELAPFASQPALDRMLARLEDQAAVGDYLSELAPFLSSATLKRLVEEKGALTAAELLELAPFLDQDVLTGMLSLKR